MWWSLLLTTLLTRVVIHRVHTAVREVLCGDHCSLPHITHSVVWWSLLLTTLLTVLCGDHFSLLHYSLCCVVIIAPYHITHSVVWWSLLLTTSLTMLCGDHCSLPRYSLAGRCTLAGHEVIPYSVELLREKLVWILRFCGYLWKFSKQNLRVWYLLAAPASNLWKVFLISTNLQNFSPTKVSQYAVFVVPDTPIVWIYEFVIKECGNWSFTLRYSSMYNWEPVKENLEIDSPLHHWANNHHATNYQHSKSFICTCTAQDGAECFSCTYPAATQYVSLVY